MKRKHQIVLEIAYEYYQKWVHPDRSIHTTTLFQLSKKEISWTSKDEFDNVVKYLKKNELLEPIKQGSPYVRITEDGIDALLHDHRSIEKIRSIVGLDEDNKKKGIYAPASEPGYTRTSTAEFDSEEKKRVLESLRETFTGIPDEEEKKKWTYVTEPVSVPDSTVGLDFEEKKKELERPKEIYPEISDEEEKFTELSLDEVINFLVKQTERDERDIAYALIQAMKSGEVAARIEKDIIVVEKETTLKIFAMDIQHILLRILDKNREKEKKEQKE